MSQTKLGNINVPDEDAPDNTDYATDLGQLDPEQERREDAAALVTIGLFVHAVLALFFVLWAVLE